jgi:HSP90 family molecular chaperone
MHFKCPAERDCVVVMQHLGTFRNYSLVNVEGADIQAPMAEQKEDADSSAEETEQLSGEELDNFCKWMREHGCKGNVQSVRASNRLINTPAMLVGHEPEAVRRWRAVAAQAAGTNAGTRKLMEAHADANAVLEVNPKHTLIRGLAARRQNDEELAALVGEQLYENAKLAAGAVQDTRGMVSRFNTILERCIPPEKPAKGRGKKGSGGSKKAKSTSSEMKQSEARE